jgi:hypothetical protein
MRDIRIGHSLAASLALAVVALAPAGADAIVTTCPPPGDAALAWEGMVPDGQCADEEEAAKVCKAWLQTCKKVVRDAAKCRNGEVSNGARLEKARCKLVSVVDPKQCKKDATDQAKVEKADVKTQRDDALAICEGYVVLCAEICD